MQKVPSDATIGAQIKTFLNVVKDVNRIPGVNISLSRGIDRQRDALAFAVNETFRQFVDSNWQLALEGVEQKIKEMSSIKDPKEATTEIANLIRHLFETRLHTFRVNSERDSNYAITYQLYTATMSSVIDSTPSGAPVSLAGIPQNLLPPWYLLKFYL